MAHPLLYTDRIDEPPANYLAKAGHVFAVFGAETQDSGNISYGVELTSERFFVKTAGDPADRRWFLPHGDRVALLRNAVCLRQTCNHAALPVLHKVIESPHGPMLVYEWAVGELLGGPAAVRSNPQSAFGRFAGLSANTIANALDVVYELHEQLTDAGWVAVDFYDGCLIYDFESHRLRVIDLDTYHRGPFINQMGRMFGSSRFMAPEEFVMGAQIDQSTTVFNLGRAAAVFLGKGVIERSIFRGTDALYDVVCRACEPEQGRRFPSIKAFRMAWQEARTKGPSGKSIEPMPVYLA